MKTNDAEQVFTNLIKRNIINGFIEFGGKDYSELLKVFFKKKYNSNEIELKHRIESKWDGSLDIDLTFTAGEIEEIVSFRFNADCTIKKRYHFSNYKDKTSGTYLIETFINEIIALIANTIDVNECYSVEVDDTVNENENENMGLTNYLLEEVNLTPTSYLSMIDEDFKA